MWLQRGNEKFKPTEIYCLTVMEAKKSSIKVFAGPCSL